MRHGPVFAHGALLDLREKGFVQFHIEVLFSAGAGQILENLVFDRLALAWALFGQRYGLAPCCWIRGRISSATVWPLAAVRGQMSRCIS